MNKSLIPVLTIGAMLLGAIFASVSPKESGQYRRAMSVFALSAAVFLAHYLLLNPVPLADIQAEVAGALIAFLIAFIGGLRSK
jgi:hypothetical protein